RGRMGPGRRTRAHGIPRPHRLLGRAVSPLGSEEERREPPAVALDERVLRAELVEQREQEPAEPLAPLGIRLGHLPEEELEGALLVARVERRERLRALARLA